MPVSLVTGGPVPLQLPWKSLTSIIEYYYMWKTTDRYVQQVGPKYMHRAQNFGFGLCSVLRVLG